MSNWLWLGMMAVIGISVASRLLWKASFGPRARARRRLVGAASSPAEGEIVTLTGTVRVIGEPLVAPLSGRNCVLYRSLGRINNGTVLLHEIDRHQMVPFELQTDFGAVLVDGREAELELSPRALIPRSLEREREFALANGLAVSNLRASTFEELAVEPGDRVAVHGMVAIDLDVAGERGYRDARKRVRLCGYHDHPLTIGQPR